MLGIIDFFTDESDDIIIASNNISVETDIYTNAIKVAQRRICARVDDYPSYRNTSAGLEQFLFQSNVIKYSQEIKSSISRCLSRDGVMDESNFKINIIDTKTTTAKLLITFSFPYSTSAKTFKVFVDHNNQRIFRGAS